MTVTDEKRAGSALRTRFPAYLLAAFALANCSADPQRAGTALVAPGGYALYDCAQLGQQEASYVTRDAELSQLMDKAKQGSGGALVSSIAYESEYQSNQAILREIRKEKSVKSCAPPPAPASAPPRPRR